MLYIYYDTNIYHRAICILLIQCYDVVAAAMLLFMRGPVKVRNIFAVKEVINMIFQIQSNDSNDVSSDDAVKILVIVNTLVY